QLSSTGSNQPGDGIVNEGVINADAANSEFFISPLNFTNAGAINVSNGDSLFIQSQSWSNSGTITVGAGSSLHLGGNISDPQLAGITNNGGTIYIDGTLDNTGQSLTVGAGSALGNVVLDGTITGGTIVDPGSGIQFRGGTLSGVTYDGTLDLSPNFSSLFVANGLTVTGADGSGPGTINLTGFEDTLFVEGPTTLDNVTIALGSASGFSDALYSYDTNGLGAVLTLGPNVVINQATSSFVQLSSTGSNQPGDGIVNEGVINADATSGAFSINPVD